MAIAGDVWQWVALGVDVAGLCLCRALYRAALSKAQVVQAAVEYDADGGLEAAVCGEPGQELGYVCVSGRVTPLDPPLTSHYDSSHTGVLQKLLFVEHKSRRSNGYWSDVKNVIKDEVNVRPFCLRGNGGGGAVRVEVREALSADGLLDALTTTHDRYVPSTDTLLARGLDRLFGDVSKGYQETEKMLNVGVKLLGIGRVAIDAGNLVLEPPTDSQPYILTSLSKKEVIKDLQGNAQVIKVFMWILGVCGGGLTVYLVYKNVRSLWERYKWRSSLRQLRAQQQASSGDDTEGSDLPGGGQCVVCLSRPREVVLLDCGHICVCADCADLLPQPRLCPICRAPVVRIVATYVS